MWQPVPLWTKASTKLVFPLLFVQRISLYHIGIAQLLAYYRTTDWGDVMPPTYIRLPVSSVWIYNATWKRWWWQNFTLHSSWRLKSGMLLQCLDSCFCLTFCFFDVVLVTSPHPTLECVYIMHVCVYICVFIFTPYMYTYTYAVYVTCGEKSNSPESSCLCLTILFLWAYQMIPPPDENTLGTPNRALHQHSSLSVG